jgi:23S rRNA (guanine2445-N2)-methyltransferase / 23S rRNA (guanine2069-N7)-methyltransferase
MEGTLDVQRDHVELIDAAMLRLAPGGTLVFSTNARRFELDPALTQRYAVGDIRAETIPEDFARRPNIHHCWMFRTDSNAG